MRHEIHSSMEREVREGCCIGAKHKLPAMSKQRLVRYCGKAAVDGVFEVFPFQRVSQKEHCKNNASHTDEIDTDDTDERKTTNEKL